MDIYTFVINEFEQLRDPVRAPAMEAYMKHKFAYFGISAPKRKAIQALVKKDYKKLSNDAIWELVMKLWERDERELQYFAQDFLISNVKMMTIDDIPYMENLVMKKSWWDTVDHLSVNVIGPTLLNYPEARNEYFYKWLDIDNMWMNRTAIIYQLKYKALTDENHLMESILKHEGSTEFFIRKAQGWALRQYAKTNPLFVSNFVEANPQLSGLTKREALRLIS